MNHTTSTAAGRLAARILLAGALLAGTTEAEMTIDPARARWSRLDFEASKLGLSTTSRIERRRMDAAAAKNELEEVAGRCELLEPSGTVERLEIATSFLGRHSRDSVLFSPGNPATYQRAVVEEGKRERYKVVRYGEDALLVERRRPATPEEESLPPSQWTGADVERVPYPPGTDRVQEPAVLLLLFSTLDLEPGQSHVLTVFTDGEIHRARVDLDGLRQMPVSFDVVDDRGMTRVDGPRTLRRITVTPESVNGREGKLELLGLKGDLEVFVDLEHGVPVLIRGQVKIAGAVEIRLVRMERS